MKVICLYQKVWSYNIFCYHFLFQSSCYSVEGVDEQHELRRLKQSMEMVGFSPETQKKYELSSLGNVMIYIRSQSFKL